MKNLVTFVAATGLAVFAFAGCNKKSEDHKSAAKPATAKTVPEAKAQVAPPSAKAGELSVAQLTALVHDRKIVPVDANSKRVRTKQGVIPGAKLITSSHNYDCESELGADKDAKYVFYCYNDSCGASHAAAERAILAGYTNVNVLPDGIVGWKKAGNKTTTIQ